MKSGVKSVDFKSLTLKYSTSGKKGRNRPGGIFMCEFYELNSIKVSGRMWIFSARKVNFLLIYLRNFNQRKVFESLH